MNGEKQKFIGGINFEELRAQRVQVYNTIEIDLSIARSNIEYVFTGTYVYAMEATDVDAYVNIRFNELFRSNINLVKGRGVRCPFYRFYLSNAAQAGKTLTLAIGIEAADFEIFDVGKALGITGTVNVAQTAPVEISPNYYHTNLKQRFQVTGERLSAAGQYPVIGLKNVGSGGEKLLVEYISAYPAVAGVIHFGFHSVDGTPADFGKNIYIGESDSLIGRVHSNSVADYTGFTRIERRATPNTLIDLTFPDLGIIVPNGKQLCIILQIVAETLNGTFRWREIT